MHRNTMQYVEQSSDSIRICVTEGQFDYSQFTVFNQQVFVHEHITITIGVIGESHFVKYQEVDDILNEVCACTDITADNNNVLLHDFFSDIDEQTKVITFGDKNYTFSFFYYDWDIGNQYLKKSALESKRRDAIECVKFAFPNSENTHTDDGPITAVFLEKGPTLTVQSFHTYPHEKVIIGTRSAFTTKL